MEKPIDIFGAIFNPTTGTTSRFNNPEWRAEKETAEDWYDFDDDDEEEFIELEEEDEDE